MLAITIRVEDFNSLSSNLVLIKQLRKLTLNPYSGMNQELNHLLKDAQIRKVNARVLLAYHDSKLVGWALMSKEKTDFYFPQGSRYRPTDGFLLEMYILSKYRRQGIGSELMKVARRKAGPYRLCVAPWNTVSTAFYQSFKNYKNKWL